MGSAPSVFSSTSWMRAFARRAARATPNRSRRWRGGKVYPVSTHPKSPKLRQTPIPTTGYLIVRGFNPDEAAVREAAEVFREKYPAWSTYGLSAFYAQDDDAVAVICRTKLVRWNIVQVFAIEDILASGLTIYPTFRTPHVTLTHSDFAELVSRLNHCRHQTINNPYYDH